MDERYYDNLYGRDGTPAGEQPRTDALDVEVDLEQQIVALLDTFHDGQREKKARAIMGLLEPVLSEVRALRGEVEELQSYETVGECLMWKGRYEAAEAELSALRSLVEEEKRGEVSCADTCADRSLDSSVLNLTPSQTTWPQRGDQMRFLGQNGYPSQLSAALAAFDPGEVLTVTACDVGSFSHSIQFAEHPGEWWNGVMFERAREGEKAQSPTSGGSAS